MKRFAALTLAALLLLSGCAKEELSVMDSTVSVKTAAAGRGGLESECSYIGTISAEGTARVISLVAGTVEKVDVEVGQQVKKGDALCSIDDTAARLTLDTAKAAISAAEAGMMSAEAGAAQANAAIHTAQQSYQATLAQYGGAGDGSLTVIEEQVRMAVDNYENTKALQEIGAASQIEVDQAYQTMLSAQAGLEAARAGLGAALAGVEQAQASLGSTEAGGASAKAGMEQAQAAVASAEYQLSLYHLTSPIDGLVQEVNVSENGFASTGTMAFVISNGEQKKVTFYVTDQVRKTLTPGQPVTVEAGGRTYSGEIAEVAGVVDVQAGLFRIKAHLNDAGDLPDGLSVELKTVAYALDDAILIPSDALYFEDGAGYVYLARDGHAVRTPVEIGLSTNETVALTGGIAEGDKVITSWSASLRDGAAIREVA